MDWEILLPLGFVFLASLGALCAGLAAIHYLRSPDVDDTPRVSVAMVAFALQYFLFSNVITLAGYLLLPTILLFCTLMALLVALWLGVQARSRAGSRIALAAFFTLSAYVCKMGSEYQQLAKFHRW